MVGPQAEHPLRPAPGPLCRRRRDRPVHDHRALLRHARRAVGQERAGVRADGRGCGRAQRRYGEAVQCLPLREGRQFGF